MRQICEVHDSVPLPAVTPGVLCKRLFLTMPYTLVAQQVCQCFPKVCPTCMQVLSSIVRRSLQDNPQLQMAMDEQIATYINDAGTGKSV